MLKFADQPERKLSLFRIEDKVYRWISSPSGTWDGIDYLDESAAIKHLRVEVETGVEFVGCDLTIVPVDPSPDERAAQRIIQNYDEALSVDPVEVEMVAQIIREETAIDSLLESVNLYVTYRFPRLRFPKAAGLDMVEGGLILSVIEALEVATKTDLGTLKKQLTEGIKEIKVYSSVPPGPKGVN